jgi:RNA polymerase sigma-70 factor (ECF subfamily)
MEPPKAEGNLQQTLKLAAAGDPDAWRELIDAYSSRVFALVLRQCGDRELAEEIAQATFVQVVSNLPKYKELGKFEPWLFRIAMNQLRDEMRRRKRQAQPTDLSQGRSDSDEAVPVWDGTDHRTPSDGRSQDPLAQASRVEEAQLLRLAVAELGEADRQVLYLRHTAGLSFAQIAQTLGEPLGTVLARGHRALAKLRKTLIDRGLQ